MFTDSIEKKSMELIMKELRNKNKLLPKLSDAPHTLRPKSKYSPKQQINKNRHISGLVSSKDSGKSFKKPTLYQINIQGNKTAYVKTELDVNSKSVSKYDPSTNQKMNLLTAQVSCRKYLNYNNVYQQYRQIQTAQTNNLQQKLSNILSNYKLAPNNIFSSPQTFDGTFQLRNKQMISKSTNNEFKKQFHRLKPQKNRKVVNPQSYKYYLGPGNNSELIRKIMKKRERWSETSESNTIFNFRWTQVSENVKYNDSLSKNGQRQILNHFEFHQELTTKSGLLRNLKLLSQKQQKFNLFDVTPITFEIDFKTGQLFQQQFKHFLHFFINNLPTQKQFNRTKKKQQERKIYTNFLKKIKNIYNLQNHTYTKKQHPNSKPIMNQIYTSKGNTYLWLLKPADLNRGRGIYLFKTLNQLAQILIQYFQRNQKRNASPYKRQIQISQQGNREKKQYPQNQINFNRYVKSQSFVIQKYIEKPMLIKKRKFDIRVWVLLTQDLDLYFFKQGYIRTSCEQFNVNKKDLFVHLTNNAIQKNSTNYGTYQKGNQLSFDELQYIFQEISKQNFQKSQQLSDKKITKSFRQDLLPEMKKIIMLSFQSIKKKMNFSTTKFCFEIFGFDFMIDQKFKLWLIQINTNPCIQQSSPILEKLLPRMLDDAFSLTIDKILYTKKQSNEIYKIDNYADDENMWQMLQNYKQEMKYKWPRKQKF